MTPADIEKAFLNAFSRKYAEGGNAAQVQHEFGCDLAQCGIGLHMEGKNHTCKGVEKVTEEMNKVLFSMSDVDSPADKDKDAPFGWNETKFNDFRCKMMAAVHAAFVKLSNKGHVGAPSAIETFCAENFVALVHNGMLPPTVRISGVDQSSTSIGAELRASLTKFGCSGVPEESVEERKPPSPEWTAAMIEVVKTGAECFSATMVTVGTMFTPEMMAEDVNNAMKMLDTFSQVTQALKSAAKKADVSDFKAVFKTELAPAGEEIQKNDMLLSAGVSFNAAVAKFLATSPDGTYLNEPAKDVVEEAVFGALTKSIEAGVMDPALFESSWPNNLEAGCMDPAVQAKVEALMK